MNVVNSAGTYGAQEGTAAEEIASHLQRVLSSSAFRASKRSYRFLEYVVKQTLDGKASTLKERTLAIEVFDRSPSWDSGEDTIVRVGAREVRKRLAQFYTSSEGVGERVRIELPSGSYVPEFTIVDAPPTVADLTAPLQEPVVTAATLPMGRTRPRFGFAAWLVVLLGVCLFALGVADVRNIRPSLFQQFWAPFLQSSTPVLVAIANPLVYHPSDRATLLNDRLLGPSPLLEQRPLQLPPGELNGADLIPVPDQYVGFGDATVAVQVSTLLAQHSQAARLRFASKLEFDDFHDAPAVLIGAYTNRWTIEFTNKLRFHFGYDKQGAVAILDAARPSHPWSLPEKKADGSSPEDYFLICRLANSPSGKPMIAAAGITMFGTEAAGYFLANPDRMNDTLRHLDSNWQTRNVELVFHAKVIGNAPGAAELVASHLW